MTEIQVECWKDHYRDSFDPTEAVYHTHFDGFSIQQVKPLPTHVRKIKLDFDGVELTLGCGHKVNISKTETNSGMYKYLAEIGVE